jgi:hypothetical protein
MFSSGFPLFFGGIINFSQEGFHDAVAFCGCLGIIRGNETGAVILLYNVINFSHFFNLLSFDGLIISGTFVFVKGIFFKSP